MQNQFFYRHKYAFSCFLSVLISLLGFVNPVLAVVFVDRFLKYYNIIYSVPVLIPIAAVKGTRIYLRVLLSKYLKGSQRAPLIWLQRRLSSRLWWLEPVVRNFGWVGMMIQRFSGKSGVSNQVSQTITYTLADTITTILSGVVYYYTRDLVLSFLSILVLPSLYVIPWFTEKSLKINRSKIASSFRIKQKNIKFRNPK